MGNSGQRLPTLFGVGVIRFFDCTWLLEGTHKEELSRWKVRVVNLNFLKFKDITAHLRTTKEHTIRSLRLQPPLIRSS